MVAGREAGYREWDPEVIGVDTAPSGPSSPSFAAGVRGLLLSEAGEVQLGARLARAPGRVRSGPVRQERCHRRGIRALWFTALGIHGADGAARALVDHVTGEMTLADADGTSWRATGLPPAERHHRGRAAT